MSGHHGCRPYLFARFADVCLCGAVFEIGIYRGISLPQTSLVVKRYCNISRKPKLYLSQGIMYCLFPKKAHRCSRTFWKAKDCSNRFSSRTLYRPMVRHTALGHKSSSTLEPRDFTNYARGPTLHLFLECEFGSNNPSRPVFAPSNHQAEPPWESPDVRVDAVHVVIRMIDPLRKTHFSDIPWPYESW